MHCQAFQIISITVAYESHCTQLASGLDHINHGVGTFSVHKLLLAAIHTAYILCQFLEDTVKKCVRLQHAMSHLGTTQLDHPVHLTSGHIYDIVDTVIWRDYITSSEAGLDTV